MRILSLASKIGFDTFEAQALRGLGFLHAFVAKNRQAFSGVANGFDLAMLLAVWTGSA